jgi:hypothetical protein
VPQTVFPTFVISGLSNVGDGGNVGTQLRRATYYQLADSISFTRGRHYFKVGVDLRKSMMSNFQPSMPSGQFSFATNQTGLLNNSKTGVAAASFLLGQGSAGPLTWDPITISWLLFTIPSSRTISGFPRGSH